MTNEPAEQLMLDAIRPDDPVTPAAGPTATSHEAADMIAKLGSGLRRRVYDFVVMAGPGGVTVEEAFTALNMRQNTASARFTELKAMGMIRLNGKTRPTASGCRAAVHVANIP